MTNAPNIYGTLIILPVHHLLFSKLGFLFQGSVKSLQYTNGLHNACVRDVELRRDGHDRDPLEGPAAAAAGLPHLHRGAHGARLHQVPARVDHVGSSRCHIYLG